MTDKKINVKLLREVRQLILDEPKRFDMHTFVARASSELPKPLQPACNTVACIAGWSVLVVEGIPKRLKHDFEVGIDDRAQLLLNLDRRQAERLFYTYAWPYGFEGAYESASQAAEEATDSKDYLAAARHMKKAARIAARRITHFIKTKGAE